MADKEPEKPNGHAADDDSSYGEAVAYKLGSMWAAMYKALIAGGVPQDHALYLVTEYLKATALQAPDGTE